MPTLRFESDSSISDNGAPIHEIDFNIREEEFESIVETPEISPNWYINKELLSNWLDRKSTLPQLSPDMIDEYFRSNATVSSFNEQFPLGNIFRKWRNGVPIWINAKSSIAKYRSCEDPVMDLVIDKWLKAGIISKAKKSPFRSNIFPVVKSGNKIRPVVDYSHLSDKTNVPKLILPSVFQVVRRKLDRKSVV